MNTSSVQSEGSLFDEKSAIYDLLIDWPKRLAHEGPFFRQIFDEVGARKVLDAACGTGRHAAMFHEWGLEVEGADLSPGMIAECRARWGEPPGLRWRMRSFAEPCDRAEAFDAVVCVGNSLALAGDRKLIEQAVLAMLRVLRPGGLCVFHVLNLWSLPENVTIWQKCKRVHHAGGDHILLKSVRKVGDRGHIDLADLELAGDAVAGRYDAADFVGLPAEELQRMARAGGAADVQFFGSHQRQPYDPATSTDLIAVCKCGAD